MTALPTALGVAGGPPASGGAVDEIMKRVLIWIAVAAVASLALSVINAQAQEADDLPRLGETAAEYKIQYIEERGPRGSA